MSTEAGPPVVPVVTFEFVPATVILSMPDKDRADLGAEGRAFVDGYAFAVGQLYRAADKGDFITRGTLRAAGVRLLQDASKALTAELRLRAREDTP